MIRRLLLLSLILSQAVLAFAQENFKYGTIKFRAQVSNEELIGFGDIDLIFYYSSEEIRIETSLLGGMMTTKVISNLKNPDKSTMALDFLTRKILIENLSKEEEKQSNTNPGNFENIQNAEIIAKDKKTILGYSCTRANIKFSDGGTAIFYISDKIRPGNWEEYSQNSSLFGFPLRMQITTADNETILYEAIEISPNLPQNWNLFDEDYIKMSYEEFLLDMGMTE
ncbi:MAG: DUF4412 domain-containing protein [Chitinophagales bacterium]|nr:DUF4412 domain-containing protein [Chitinophagales bacterium]